LTHLRVSKRTSAPPPNISVAQNTSFPLRFRRPWSLNGMLLL